MKRYSLNELEAMPTIRQGHCDDLKVKTDDTRVWLSRMTVADGMEYNNQVQVYKLNKNHDWKLVQEYEAEAIPSNKDMLIENAKRYGRSSLSPYVIGVLSSVLSYDRTKDKEKVKESLQVIKDYQDVSNDDTIPWDTTRGI
jgi:hypothetical protein